MKKYFTQILLLLIIFPSAINAQWYLQQVDPVPLRDIKFINKYTGWVCGENLIYKTTNSGTNWILQPNPAQSIIFEIQSVNDSVVYAAGWCTILKTTNGGEDWIGLRAGTPKIGCTGQYYRGLYFIDENTGWFCGGQTTIRTTDGGNTFIDSMGIAGSLFDIHFKDDSTGIISSFSNKIFRTTNSGFNWYLVPLSPSTSTSECYRLSFVNETGWTAASGSNILYKTTNYGMSWDSICQIFSGSNARTYSVEFPSLLIGYAGGHRGKVFKTTDGGFNWELEPTEIFDKLAMYTSIYAYNDSIVWVAGGLGKILYTTTGGGLIVNNQSSNFSVPESFTLYQNYPNPFNPTTKIKFDVKNKSDIKILISDLSGKLITYLTDKEHQSGTYEIIFNAMNFSSGIYFYQMIVDGQILYSKKMIFLK
ncbi:MAG: T9SS type A sorting domain-containing protein [Bacteroidota bacterium]|nr:T9SS type A sorting domain-containing protein [Bacteroidota bacterium]